MADKPALATSSLGTCKLHDTAWSEHFDKIVSQNRPAVPFGDARWLGKVRQNVDDGVKWHGDRRRKQSVSALAHDGVLAMREHLGGVASDDPEIVAFHGGVSATVSEEVLSECRVG
jgi:hypothetical protein